MYGSPLLNTHGYRPKLLYVPSCCLNAAMLQMLVAQSPIHIGMTPHRVSRGARSSNETEAGGTNPGWHFIVEARDTLGNISARPCSTLVVELSLDEAHIHTCIYACHARTHARTHACTHATQAFSERRVVSQARAKINYAGNGVHKVTVFAPVPGRLPTLLCCCLH